MINRFFAELSRRLAESGIESMSKEGEKLIIILHAQPVLYVSAGNDVFLCKRQFNQRLVSGKCVCQTIRV